MKSFKLFSELHPAQPVPPPEVCQGSERRSREVLLVDTQQGVQAGTQDTQVGTQDTQVGTRHPGIGT